MSIWPLHLVSAPGNSSAHRATELTAVIKNTSGKIFFSISCEILTDSNHPIVGPMKGVRFSQEPLNISIFVSRIIVKVQNIIAFSPTGKGEYLFQCDLTLPVPQKNCDHGLETIQIFSMKELI